MQALTKEDMLTDQDLDQSIPNHPKYDNEPGPIAIPRMEEYDTGDILLFSDRTFIPSRLIEYFTDSKYSHAGIVLRDPTFLDKPLEGLYVMESTGFSDIKDAEDNEIKFGVQIRPLEDVFKKYDGAIFWRKLTVERNEDFYKNLAEAHRVVHNKPYDTNPIDWIESLFDIKLGDVQLTDRFFCSAMVCFVYDKLGLVTSDTPWTIIRPRDLGTENPKKNRISFVNCLVDTEFTIKCYDSYMHYLYNTY